MPILVKVVGEIAVIEVTDIKEVKIVQPDRNVAGHQSTKPIAYDHISVPERVFESGSGILGSSGGHGLDKRSGDVYPGGGQRERGGVDRGALSPQERTEDQGPPPPLIYPYRDIAALVLELSHHTFTRDERGRAAELFHAQLSNWLDCYYPKWREDAWPSK